jgi:DNA repair exonuclease SbcCD ATPase subunit
VFFVGTVIVLGSFGGFMINQLKLINFGIHKEFSAKFPPGINAIIGENRRGKTHILEAICYSLFGKTQNSKLEKIINFDSKEAIVILDADDIKVTRKRSGTTSTLARGSKLELETKLKVDYNEFLSIFYISSHEQKSLFDPSYLRKFLISIFNLDKYSKRYEILSAEYRGLQAAEREVKQVNLPLIKKRFDKVKAITAKIKEGGVKYEEADQKLTKAARVISSKWGEVRAHKAHIQRKIAQVNQHKCTSCGQKIHEDYKQVVLAKVKEAQIKIQKFEVILKQKETEVSKKQDAVNTRLNKINEKVFQGRQILTRLQERAKDTGSKVNKQRIKALEQVLPILSPKGFPAYLLQVYVPVITETTNNLLQVIFPDMSVTIRTEKPESNQPDFKPLIHKGENVQEMSDLSGSERAVINLCFRLGIMVIYKQLCDTAIDFFMVDEGFELIDLSNCMKVISLLENFISLGYIKQAFLVTHKTELKNLENVNYVQL